MITMAATNIPTHPTQNNANNTIRTFFQNGSLAYRSNSSFPNPVNESSPELVSTSTLLLA
jgi:hypothetical protein